MDTLAFLRKVLPATGLYVIARHIDGKWRHQVCETLEEAAHYALEFDRQGVATYHACAAYREPFIEVTGRDGKTQRRTRTQKNVRALKAFWMDLDVGEADTKYPSQDAALDGLVAFCVATGLPIPMVVSSGYGIHLYWTLTDEIHPDFWQPTADALKALAVHHGLLADHACTSDSARVLRPVETTNRKRAGDERLVCGVNNADPLRFDSFRSAVARAVEAAGVKPQAAKHVEETEKLNEDFAVRHDYPPFSAVRAAERCQQLAKVRDTRGNVPEPVWYAALQLVVNAKEGDDLGHQWSNGYAGYSHAETERKLEQARGFGPPFCKTFADRNPGGCDGCPHKGNISTPAQLGVELDNAPPPRIEVAAPVTGEPAVVDVPAAPEPFSRGDKGVWMLDDGVPHQIYPYDIYPVDLVYDETVGYEVVRIRHQTPQGKWLTCSVRAALIAKPTDFEIALRDNHIQPLSRKRMIMYMDAYIREIRQKREVQRLFRTMGWKNDATEFVLGPHRYLPDGSIDPSGHSAQLGKYLEWFKPKGDLTVWREATRIFNLPGTAAHAFLLLVAFAAPLLALCNRDGFTVSALGESGVGKSTMGKFLASVYGHPTQTWVPRDSTVNARIERLGAYHSVPLYIDELSTINPEDLRDFIYMIPTGKGRDALTRSREAREAATWRTIVVGTTNDSMLGKLQLVKQNAEAEALRLFEINMPENPQLLSVLPFVHQIADDNYGVAGTEYVRRLVTERSRIRGEIGSVISTLETEFEMAGKERFWSQAAALTLYGGRLAKEWGLIDFDLGPIRAWLRDEISVMRDTVSSSMLSPVAILAEYLNAHAGERLVVTKLNKGMTATNSKPMRAISQRYEKDCEQLWCSRAHVRNWITKRHYNYTQLKNQLTAQGVLLAPDHQKNLGAGTDYDTKPAPCWLIRMDHPVVAGLTTEAIT